MSIFQKKTVIDSYPAYDVVTLEETKGGFINLKAGDMLIAPNHLSKFTINSAASYALSYNECPITAYNRSVALDQKAYWINGVGSCISSQKQAKKEYIQIKVGQKVIFEGKTFEITAENNDNRGLKEI